MSNTCLRVISSILSIASSVLGIGTCHAFVMFSTCFTSCSWKKLEFEALLWMYRSCRLTKRYVLVLL
uniref:Putative secreted peptide n=1 Tax=Anopheles braziliensis TaxID=58242 RepID=A0A2M3ZY33_9DIPT